MADFSSIKLFVKLHNADDFSELVEKFNQKARELEEISHELMNFQFQGEIENKVLSDNAD